MSASEWDKKGRNEKETVLDIGTTAETDQMKRKHIENIGIGIVVSFSLW